MEDATTTASAIVDTLRHLLSVLGAILGSVSGQAVAQDVVEVRSLPALEKAVRRFWFETPIRVESWDSKEQALWLCRLLTVAEGSRGGVLSFYGAGLLLSEALAGFAEVACADAGVELDEVWSDQTLAVQEALRGRHWEQLQQWPADQRCGGGPSPALLSPDRLPCTMRRAFDLEGKRLSAAQVAGIGVAMMMPGSTVVAMGGVGATLLMRKAKEQRSLAAVGADGSNAEDARWKALQMQCLDHAHDLLRRKTCPIQVRYLPGDSAPAQVKVSLYAKNDPLCAMPVGSVLGGGTGGDSVAKLAPGEQCSLRPAGGGQSFRLRVYRPAVFLDVVLNDGVEVKRGDRLLLAAAPTGTSISCYIDSIPAPQNHSSFQGLAEASCPDAVGALGS